MRHNRRRSRLPRIIFIIVMFIAGIGLGFAGGWRQRARVDIAKRVAEQRAEQALGTKLHKETVDVLGGSAAHGWKDPNNDSYLKRAFAARTDSTNVTYQYVDHTIVGETPDMLKSSGSYQQWLKQDKPQVVVLSWGMLNSMLSRHAISRTLFIQMVHAEIAEALKAHAVVLIVTPPIVEQTATADHHRIGLWINALYQDADSFHSKNIYKINLYQQTESYMTIHGVNEKQYFAGTWHPNQAGHILAGSILANDLINLFGLGPITWRR